MHDAFQVLRQILGSPIKQAFGNKKAKSLVKDKEIIIVYAKYPISYKHEKAWKYKGKVP